MSVQTSAASTPPFRTVWWLIGIGAILASEIAAVLSLGFLFLYGNPAAFWLTGTSSGLFIYFVAAPLAGLLVGWFLWWLCIWRPGRATVRRGVLFGALSGIIAHPFVWTIASLSIGNVGHPFLWEFAPPFQWINQVWIVSRIIQILHFSLLSLVAVGWITLVVGGLTGGLLVSFQKTRMQRWLQRNGYLEKSQREKNNRST